MANISRAIVQGGLALRATQDYDEQVASRSYAQRIRDFGVKHMESGERSMAAEDTLLDQETAEKRASLADRGRVRENEEDYRKLVAGGASFDVLAEEAQKRGDLGSMKNFRDAKANFEREGLKAVVHGALTGADDLELERIFNSSGKTRVDTGSIKMDRKSGIINFTKNGQPISLNISSVGELLGMLKRPEMKQTVVGPGEQLAIDGKIVATNPRDDYKRGEVAINPETGQPYFKYPQVAGGVNPSGAMAAPGGVAAAAGGINQPGGAPAPGARPPRRLEAHEDSRVSQGTSVVFRAFGVSDFAGLDPKIQPKVVKIIGLMGGKVRAGMNPDAAAVASIKEIDHAEAALAAGGRAGGGAAYTGPTPWRATPSR